ASKNPSCCRPSQASRLFRHSQYARCSGSGCDSMVPTRPMNVSSGASVKVLAASPLRRARSASRIARRPVPAAHVAVYAAMESGVALMAAKPEPSAALFDGDDAQLALDVGQQVARPAGPLVVDVFRAVLLAVVEILAVHVFQGHGRRAVGNAHLQHVLADV